MKLYSLIIILWLPGILISQSCLPDGIEITSQAQIDSFAINYPNCTEIEGYVIISGDDITSLNGLTVIESAHESFAVWGCNSLLDLTGLENLSYIGGWLQIIHNDSLTSLTKLSGVTTIGGTIQIIGNDAITNLDGLENIDAGSINHLSIYWNHALSRCNIENVCYYLLNSPSIVSIYDNALGCNSQTEIEAACIIDIDEFSNNQKIDLYPNPAKNFIMFDGEEFKDGLDINIYSLTGKSMLKLRLTTNKIDISKLEKGVYLLELKSNNYVSSHKLIKK